MRIIAFIIFMVGVSLITVATEWYVAPAIALMIAGAELYFDWEKK